MNDSAATRRPEQTSQDRHLRVLAWLLLLLVAVHFGSSLLLRPPRAERLRLAAFRDAMGAIGDLYVEEVDRDTLYQGAMRGMVAALSDRYSAYLTPEQRARLNEDTEGKYAGIGIMLFPADGRAIVEDVFPDGPAAAAGLQAGDSIVRIDGRPVADLRPDQILDMIRGRVGTSVELTLVRPPQDEPLALTLTRDNIAVPSVKSEVLADNVGLLRITSFSQSSAAGTRAALEDLQKRGIVGLVLDLRGNAGGLVGQATAVCDMFVESGLLLAQEGRGGRREPNVLATPGTVLPGVVPVVVLVDEGTASAAEIVAGALQAHGRATVVGTGTVGKGAVNTVIRLPDGAGLVLTVTRYMLAGGRAVDGVGITPDVLVGEMPALPEGLEAAQVRAWVIEHRKSAREAQMRKALEVIGAKAAEQR
ncbi:MAG: S41 family peptidase [Candidatus Brocadiaceae bacterium]|nr:S41 family peptidase [Candidatus Brocadiaceae bacterium]